jgi:hypothetical protein
VAIRANCSAVPHGDDLIRAMGPERFHRLQGQALPREIQDALSFKTNIDDNIEKADA